MNQDFLNELADYLEDQSVGTVATVSNSGNIFIGKLPASPNNCIALLGLPGTILADSRDVASLNFPRFQVLIRNEDYSDGAQKLIAVRTALHGLLGYYLPHWRIMRCHAEQEGGPIGSDDQDRFEFTINFIAELNDEDAPTPPTP